MATSPIYSLFTQQSLIVVKDSAITRKVALSSEWPSTVAMTLPDVERMLQNESLRKILLIVAEDEFEKTYEVLKQTERRMKSVVGLLVLARDPEDFFRVHADKPELLEAVLEKNFKKSPEPFLFRAFRQLWRLEAQVNPKVNQKTLEQLNEIFIDLSAERDPQQLLANVLMKAIELTSAEGGILYMLSETDGDMHFKLKISNDRTLEVNFEHMNLKVVENSICGFVTLTGKALNLGNTSTMKPMVLPQHNKTLDHYVKGEIPKSILTLPLRNGRNEIVAVLQLVNKRNESSILDRTGKPTTSTVAFDAEDESILSSFGSQAAICMENVDLYADIQRLFEGFVKASITAIESRDPSTGGHSERVAKICVGLARATSECETGIYRSVKFKEEEVRELEYAALLHDFGKIGVREEVLVKAKKLYGYQLESIKERIKICKAAAKISYLEKRLKQSDSESQLDREYEEKLKRIDHYWEIILQANEPTVLRKESIEALGKIHNEQLLLPDGTFISLLTEDEFQALSVTRGSLTDSERLEIESHVRHTYQFLKMIPWTRDFRHLPEIAYGHHEKLDGTGYPRGLMSHEIPLQSKIMTIADIFDALTASDRWYKEAVPNERAIDILAQEVAQGKIDPVLFDLFVERRIFDLTQPKNVSQVA